MAWLRAGGGALLIVVLLPVLFSAELQTHAAEVQELDAHGDGLVMSSADFMRRLHIKGKKRGAAAAKQSTKKYRPTIGKHENFAHLHDWAMARRKRIAAKARKKEAATKAQTRRKLAKGVRSVQRAKRKEVRKERRVTRKIEKDTRKVNRTNRKATQKASQAIRKSTRKAMPIRKTRKAMPKGRQVIRKSTAQKDKKRPSAQLGESLETTVHKMSDADRAALNLEAAQAFPEQASRIVKLRKRLAPVARRVAMLRQRTGRVHDSVVRREQLLDRIAEKHEFDLMTNPVAESAQLAAESKLKGLRDREEGLSRETSKASQSSESLARQLAHQEGVQELNRKAVVLFRRYKTHFKSRMALKSASFKAHSLRAAESAAKARYHKYAAKMRHRLGEDKDQLKVSLLHMQQERETRKQARIAARAVRSQKRAVRRAARLAEEEVRMHREAKAQAAMMFKQYMARYKESTEEESEQDLGESSTIEAKPAKAAAGTGDELDHILDRVSKTVRKLPKLQKHLAPKPQKAFGLDSN